MHNLQHDAELSYNERKGCSIRIFCLPGKILSYDLIALSAEKRAGTQEGVKGGVSSVEKFMLECVLHYLCVVVQVHLAKDV